MHEKRPHAGNFQTRQRPGEATRVFDDKEVFDASMDNDGYVLRQGADMYKFPAYPNTMEDPRVPQFETDVAFTIETKPLLELIRKNRKGSDTIGFDFDGETMLVTAYNDENRSALETIVVPVKEIESQFSPVKVESIYPAEYLKALMAGRKYVRLSMSTNLPVKANWTEDDLSYEGMVAPRIWCESKKSRFGRRRH